MIIFNNKSHFSDLAVSFILMCNVYFRVVIHDFELLALISVLQQPVKSHFKPI